ncbi:glutamate-rich protein 4 [Erinaceus europaeus]|uniref:Glutamate-rich protein 4 n=1 Tax=Erinaceus europaeus TaxID=9365 RepID=A0A1S3AKT5_ERIEU|nr:glutamate-rich protein 4 [Erinaceus europaeus]
MEVWVQLWQAGLMPPELGAPPQVFMRVPPEKAGQTTVSPGPDTGGTRESLLWIWEELGKLRRVDVQLLGQLCSLGLEMGAFREELVAFLEEEEDILEEEDEEPEQQEEGPAGGSYSEPGYRLPDFEMTI